MIKPYWILIFGISLFLNSCNKKEQLGELIIKEIEYPVDLVKGGEDAKTLQVFLADIMEKAKKHELPVFYYMSDTLMPMENDYLDYLFHHVDTEYIENEMGDLEPIAIEENLEIDGISKLKFLEEWYFNKSTNQFSKKVIAVCPMVEKFKNAEESLGFKGLFWIYLAKELPKK